MDALNDTTCPVQNGWVLKEVAGRAIGLIAFFVLIGIPAWVLAGSFFAAMSESPSARAGEYEGWAVFTGIFAAVTVLSVLPIILLFVRKFNFHYSFDERFLVVEQGIIAKQKRYIPYSAFQDILVLRSWTDQLFGFATVCIENASGVGGAILPVMTQYGAFSGSRMRFGVNRWLASLMGANGNVVGIPGLSREDAQKVRQEALGRIAQTAHLDRSGL